MSERLKVHEHGHEQPKNTEVNERSTESLENQAETTKQPEETPSVESINEKVERHSKSKNEVENSFQESHTQDKEEPHLITPSLKSQVKKRSLRDIRKDLPAPSRAFSKIIHQPVVDAISEVGGKTVARPTGLLTGGMFSLISSMSVLFIAKYYGYEYNFFIGIASFAGGFLTGLIIESLAKTAHKITGK